MENQKGGIISNLMKKKTRFSSALYQEWKKFIFEFLYDRTILILLHQW